MREVVEKYVNSGDVPQAVGLVARGEDVRVAAAGVDADAIFRIASITKPITAAAVMLLVEDGSLTLESPVAQWLPELASPVVVRTPGSPVDDADP